MTTPSISISDSLIDALEASPEGRADRCASYLAQWKQDHPALEDWIAKKHIEETLSPEEKAVFYAKYSKYGFAP